MSTRIYRNLAISGIRKNKKLYLPYILTCIGTVMMSYIISFLSASPTVAGIKGGNTLQIILGMGFGVMCVFSLIFLFYTNSFLVRRRKKEFGLYNILGLGKRHLGIVLFLETMMIAAISIVGGLFFGILFSKLAELCLVKILGGAATFSFIIGTKSVVSTLILFVVIFGLIYLNTLRQIQLTNPIQLLHSENAGEKPPKANWLLALLGVVMLAAAYYLAVSIQDPIVAITVFFIAVIMVIVGTYLLFIAGSVALCRLLQKNKHYYYKTNHFVSVSSMVYRMKRNGAGLASICILCTMVLVMISSTVCLYIGTEDSLRSQYPRDINLLAQVSDINTLYGENIEQIQKLAGQIVTESGYASKNILNYSTADFVGVIEGQTIIFDKSVVDSRMAAVSGIWQVFIVPLSDYNRLMGTNEALSPGEVMIYTTKERSYAEDSICLEGGTPLKIVKRVDDFEKNRLDTIQIVPSIYLFVPDFETVIIPLEQEIRKAGSSSGTVSLNWYYGFDLSCKDSEQIRIAGLITDEIRKREIEMDENEFFHTIMQEIASRRVDFYALFGGLFFLGVLLGIAFIFAVVLIIYYKQVSEGYEDKARFDIMKKVGMTKKEIKKSINSQVLTIFFMPIITAGIHLSFAFPFIRKMLLMFGLNNQPFLIITTICCYAVFLLFYVVVFLRTSRAYFLIVNDMKDDGE